MNIRDIAKKVGSYISSKTQDDEGWIRQGKFTPVKQTQQMGQNLSAWGNIAKQGISNQVNTQKQDFNQFIWQPIKENAFLSPIAQRYENAIPAIKNQITNKNPLNPFMPKNVDLGQNWKDTKALAGAGLTTAGLLASPAVKLTSMLGGAVINPLVKLGTNIYENKKGEELNKQLMQNGQPIQYQKKSIGEGVVNSISEGAGQGLANAGTTQLTSYLVQKFSNLIPVLKPLTEKAIKEGSPVVTDTIEQSIKKFFNTAGKRIVKAAVIETAVESPIWATLTQTEQETYLEALVRETEQNLIMNVGMAGVQTLSDTRALSPIIKKTIDDTINNYWKNASSPESLAKQGGYIDMFGNIKDGTARTRDFYKSADVWFSNGSTPQQKMEAIDGIQQIAKRMFSARQYKQLTFKQDPSVLIKAVNQKIKADIDLNTGYQEPVNIPNFKDWAKSEQGGIDLTDKTKPFPQQPSISTPQNTNLENKIEFPKGYYEDPTFRNMSSKEFLEYANKNSDFRINADDVAALKAIENNENLGYFSPEQIKKDLKEVRLKNADGGGIIKLTPEQGMYFLKLRGEFKQISKFSPEVEKLVTKAKNFNSGEDFDKFLRSWNMENTPALGGKTPKNFWLEINKSQISPESKGIIKLKDNDLVKTFDETIKIKPSEKVNISSPENMSDIQGNGINQDVQMPVQKKTIKIKSTEQPSVSSQDSLSQGPYLDAKGELQFPGIENTKNIFTKPELDISQTGKDKGSILGGDGFKASPEVKQTFATWVNSRRASQIEGIIKGKEFKDLDSKGIDGIFEFQSGNKTGRFADIKKYFDDKFTDLNTKGVNINYKQDYLPQMWNNSTAEVQQVFGNRLGLKPSFTLDSIIKNYQEGIEAGLTPKYTKVSDLIASYEARANKSLADRQFFDEVKKANIILPANKAPLDWVTLDPDRFPRLSFTTEEGKYTGIYKAPADIGTMINNYLANPSTSPNVFLKGLNSVANWTSSVKNRVLSFGIPGTAINAHGFNILARNVMSSKNPIEGAITGIKYMLAPGTAVKDLDRQLTQFGPEAVKNGLTLSANEFKSVLEAPVGIKSKIGATWDKLFEKGLFDRMLPTLKLQKYKEVYDGFVKGGMNKSEAGRAAAKFTNDVFGGINMEELGKSRDMQNLLRVTILAPDWLQTNINLAKKLPASVIKISDKTSAPYRKFLATFIGTYVTMNLVNKLSSGHWMYENDSGNTFNIEAGYTADGQKRYIRPFGTAADFIRIPADVLTSLSKGDVQAPVRVVRNRLSIPLGVGLGAITDTDYTGNPIGYKGKDKWGNEMPTGQRAFGVGGELATLAGLPAFAKQGLDYVSGKTKLEPALLQGAELPFRYSGGAYNKTQQKITGLLQDQGVTGKELYDANESIKGLSFSDKDMEKIKTGGIDAFNKLVKSKQTSAKLNAELKGTGYTKSEDAPKNVVSKVITYGKATITDPKATLDAVIAGNPVRKVENGYVVLERSQGLGQIDRGNKSTQVDHIVPLEFGGKNPSKNSAEILTETKGMTPEQKKTYLAENNLEELPIEQHKIKTAVQAELSKKLSRGEITKQDAKRMLENWKDQISLLTPSVKSALATDLSVSDTVAEITDGKTYTITSEAGNDKEYDITSPIVKPTATGLTEVDKLNFSKYNSAITTRKNDIKKVLDSGQITPEQAETLLSDLKKKTSSGTGKSKKIKVTFKAAKYDIPKINIKFKKPTTSTIKLKSAPKIKVTSSRKYTIKA